MELSKTNFSFTQVILPCISMILHLSCAKSNIMKAIVICLLCSLSLVQLSAQEKHKDSLATEITTLEKLKFEISSRVDRLSEQLTNEFSVLQTLKAKIESIDAIIAEQKADLARIERKNERTAREKKLLEDGKKVKAERDKQAKAFAGLESKFNKSLAVLDESIGLRNELDEKIQQLKAQYATL